MRGGELRVRAARDRRWADVGDASSGSSERGARRERNQRTGSRRREVGMPTAAVGGRQATDCGRSAVGRACARDAIVVYESRMPCHSCTV